METAVLAAFIILGTIFIASFVALILVCRHKYCQKKLAQDYISEQHAVNSGEAQLVEDSRSSRSTGEASGATGPQEGATGVELNEVGLNPNLEQFLDDYTWVNDATGLVPHCLCLLRTCHQLTERMVGVAMNGRTTMRLSDIMGAAKQINPRVDEIIMAIYPPIDPRLLEARCTALFMSVRHLVLICQGSCRRAGITEWIQRSLEDVEKDLEVLREASISYDTSIKAAIACEGGATAAACSNASETL